MGQIGTEWDKSGNFSDQIQYILSLSPWLLHLSKLAVWMNRRHGITLDNLFSDDFFLFIRDKKVGVEVGNVYL